MNTAFEVVPEGFEPAGDTPLEDLLANFEGLRYVIVAGTKHERGSVFTNTEDVRPGITRETMPSSELSSRDLTFNGRGGDP